MLRNLKGRSWTKIHTRLHKRVFERQVISQGFLPWSSGGSNAHPADICVLVYNKSEKYAQSTGKKSFVSHKVDAHVQVWEGGRKGVQGAKPIREGCVCM